eukprot:199130_1
MSVLFLLIYLVIKDVASHHILVTSTCSSYSHWVPLFHISNELLSRTHENHFLTFVVSETCHHWVDNAMNENQYKTNFQIIYTPSEPKTNLTEYENLNFFSLLHKALNRIVMMSFPSYPAYRAIFTSTNPHDFKPYYAKYNLLATPDQTDHLLNDNLVNISNDYSTLKLLNNPVDLLLTESFSILPILLCDKVFDIPVISWTAIMFSMLETPFYLDLNEPLYMISDEIDTVFKSYAQRWMNMLSKMFVYVLRKYIGYFVLTPITKEVFFDFADIYVNTVFIHCLGPPFAPIIYHRPSWRPFGFLLVNNSVDHSNDEYKEIYHWVDKHEARSVPVVLISMGSTLAMHSSSKVRAIYDILRGYSNNGEAFACLMSIKQDINDGEGNEQLETDFFKIVKWFPQFDLLRHANVQLFINHGGLNGVQEALFSKTLQIIFAGHADHSFNAKRIEALQCGLRLYSVEDADELKAHVDALLLNESSAMKYGNQCEIKHEMIKQLGNVEQAADLVEFGAKYGLKHFFSTDGLDSETIPWYQKTTVDVFCVFGLVILLFVYFCFVCCRMGIKCFCNKSIAKQKSD